MEMDNDIKLRLQNLECKVERKEKPYGVIHYVECTPEMILPVITKLAENINGYNKQVEVLRCDNKLVRLMVR